MSVRAYVGLGANLSDRLGALRQAVAALEAEAGTVAAVSSVYETEAWVLPGTPPQPDHLNAVVALDTDLEADVLLDVLHAIERLAGRDHDAPRWSPRALDLDLLLWSDLEVGEPDLVLPHPGLASRRFVLAPLAEIAPDLEVPGLDTTVAALLKSCPDDLRVGRAAARLRSVELATPPSVRPRRPTAGTGEVPSGRGPS
ncbi:2-amino-4-hydroxy-6-hydroxymethyldihydropteridine diphosphokinase [Rubrivirga sp.]|uniref:2-amino-4-hydroxy-6- hydroxymethyldihydropteridine diphosphokinase n=1 Tax=Rubrivirga sp. TaxID=1885344 RepID=UPI003C736BA2